MSTGILPNRTFGKLDKNFILPISRKNELQEKDIVIIGDRLYTDIQLTRDTNDYFCISFYR